MKLFGYTIVKTKELKKLKFDFEMLTEIHKRHLEKINRFESVLTRCQHKIDEQEKSIAKYQRILGTNTKPKWSWEKWK